MLFVALHVFRVSKKSRTKQAFNINQVHLRPVPGLVGLLTLLGGNAGRASKQISKSFVPIHHGPSEKIRVHLPLRQDEMR